ncbi:cytochrome-b5 reductase PWA37_004893 [Arxiozyma heterogenica]|uniref:NADH-cytochrome b5 reductase n=1 Tax=Arxiozyma heterogenica TaxID=278026 RepID=A0AAN7WP80_9SACH|nr:hypothetical protein RI543_001292 [Kazachstania heterogenica]
MFSQITKPQNSKLLTYIIGATATFAVATTAYHYTSSKKTSFSIISNESPKVFIGDNKWIDLPLLKVEEQSHDTKLFTFKLPTDDSVTGLTLASAVLTKFFNEETGKNVIRPYTPVSDLNMEGSFQLIIKHYPGGPMTNHIFKLKPNDTLSFKGPIKKWDWVPNSFERITLLGAGTGITPLFQLARHIVENPNDNTKVDLIYGNKTPNDILLKHELDALHKKYPDKFNVSYFVDSKESNLDSDSKLHLGFISKEFLKTNIAKATEKTHVFVCGPPPFMKAFSGEKVSPKDQGELIGILKELGYTKEQVFKF